MYVYIYIVQYIRSRRPSWRACGAPGAGCWPACVARAASRQPAAARKPGRSSPRTWWPSSPTAATCSTGAAGSRPPSSPTRRPSSSARALPLGRRARRALSARAARPKSRRGGGPEAPTQTPRREAIWAKTAATAPGRASSGSATTWHAPSTARTAGARPGNRPPPSSRWTGTT